MTDAMMSSLSTAHVFDVRREGSAMTLDLIKTLSDLVALPSVNPMGRAVSGPEYLRVSGHRLSRSAFPALGLPYQRQTVEPKRDNIVARLDGDVPPSEGGPLLLFEAHQDTVPVAGMTIEPWTPDGARRPAVWPRRRATSKAA